MKHLQFVLLVLFTLSSCFSNSAQDKNKSNTIAVEEFKALIDQHPNVQLIDVRTAEEYAEGHLANAVNMDYNGDHFKTSIQTLDKSKLTMIYCLSGGRSASAMQYMITSGFQKVTNMKGGLLQWNAKQMPLNLKQFNNHWKGMSKEAYKNLISGDIPVVIDFNAKWCGPCKQLKPILDEIQKEYSGKIKIISVDIDENKSLSQSMYVNNIPLLIYHERGEVILNQEGMLDKEGLVKLFRLKK